MNELTIRNTITEMEEDMNCWKRMSYHDRYESNKEQYLKNQTSNRHFYESVLEFASTIPEGRTIVETVLDDSDRALSFDKMDYTDMVKEHLDDYIKDVRKEMQESTDIVQLLVRKADCISRKERIVEAVVTGTLADNITDRIKNSLVDYGEDIPMITPFFTPDEMEGLQNHEVDPYEYVFGTDQKELHEKLRTTVYEYEQDPTEENAKKLIALGWNPSVPYNEQTIKFARDRIVKWFNENKKIQLIDLSEMAFDEATNEKEGNIHPVHIVLFRHDQLVSRVIRGWTRSEFSHAGLTFDGTLKHIFSYNARKDDAGFVDESIEQYKKESKGGYLEVVTFFVSSKVKAKIQKMIKFFMDNKSKTSYAFDNILRYVTKRAIDTSKSLNMVCSQFVDFALKSCNIDLTNKPSNLVFPGDFENPQENSRMFITFKDSVEKFKPQAITNRVRFLLKRPHDELITRSALGEHYAIDQFCKTRNPLYLFTESSDPKVDVILKEIQNCLTAEAIITEAKPSPLRFGKKGDLYIDLPRNLEREYQDAHTLLISYSESNTSGIKHELARLFYINTLLEDRIQKMKVGDKQYKQCIDLRARVRNDFTKYFKVVSSQEKDFDFEKYYKSTEYYSKTIKVSGDTLKYSGKLIKAFLQSQGI